MAHSVKSLEQEYASQFDIMVIFHDKVVLFPTLPSCSKHADELFYHVSISNSDAILRHG